MKRMLAYAASVVLTKNWICSFIHQEGLDLHSTVFYTYWFDAVTMGVGLAKTEYSGIRVISRAHRFDVYPEQHSPPVIPFRREALRLVDSVVFVSKAATDYYAEMFPEFEEKYKTSYLGVNDPGFLTRGSGPGCFNVVSCSSLVPVKRVDLLIKGLSHLGKIREDMEIEWIHLGGGPLEGQIKNLAQNYLPANIRFNFKGHLPNQEVFEFYREQPVDLLINVSSSEGLPVSIMEAQSCGIPVIATGVGGNPEIVNSENGLLLCADPTPQEISRAIESFLIDPLARQEKARISRLNWEEKFNATANHTIFARGLAQSLLGAENKLSR